MTGVVTDSRYTLYMEFAGENGAGGRPLKEWLLVPLAAVLAHGHVGKVGTPLGHGGSDPFRAVL